MSKTDDDIKTVKGIYAAFLGGDFEKWLSFFDENSVLWEAQSLPYGGTFRGSKAIKDAILRMVACWDDVKLDVTDILANEHRVIAYGTFSGTGKATGKRASFPITEMWVISKGKVAEIVAIYADTALALSVLK